MQNDIICDNLVVIKMGEGHIEMDRPSVFNKLIKTFQINNQQLAFEVMLLNYHFMLFGRYTVNACIIKYYCYTTFFEAQLLTIN